jgi:hypothetical protein
LDPPVAFKAIRKSLHFSRVSPIELIIGMKINPSIGLATHDIKTYNFCVMPDSLLHIHDTKLNKSGPQHTLGLHFDTSFT